MVYKKDIPAFKIRFYPLIAVSYSKIRTDITDTFSGAFGYLEEANFSSVSFTPGIGFTISSPRLDDRYSFYLELRYLKNSVNDRVIYSKASYDDNDMTLSYRYILIPFTFKYDIGIGERSALFVKGGMIKTFKLDAKFVNERRVSLYPNNPPQIEERFEFYSGQVGLVGGVGYQHSLTKKLNLCAEARWENIGPLTNSPSVVFLQDLFSFSVALSF
jgi:hypothetical protein